MKTFKQDTEYVDDFVQYNVILLSQVHEFIDPIFCRSVYKLLVPGA